MNACKSERRRLARACRAEAARTLHPTAAGRMALDNLRRATPLRGDSIVSGFWPIGSEIDSRPILGAFASAGATCCLPVVAGADRALVFRAWKPGEPLESGGFGTSHPMPSAPVVTPNILLAPLLAFDRIGFRLGYGGGFYDRTLEGLRAADGCLAIGLAYAAQEMDSVPIEPTDQKLDWIATESEAIEIDSIVRPELRCDRSRRCANR